MSWYGRIPGVRQRNVVIASIGVAVIAIGSGVGVYLDSRAHPPLQQEARYVAAKPTPPVVGTTTVALPQQAVILALVSSVPADGSESVPLNAGITVSFNLAVTPAAAKSFISVRSSTSGATNLAGKLAQGKTPQDVVFTPSTSFGYGSAVIVMLRHGLASRDGTQLSNDVGFSFTTTLEPETVNFDSRLVGAPAGRPVTLGIQVGAQMSDQGAPANFTLKTYKASVKDLLAALVYTGGTDSYQAYVDTPIDTRSMTLVGNGGTSLTASGARVTDVAAADSVTISQPPGIYLILAMDGDRQAGSAWVDISRYGVILRQDDQRVVVAGQDLINGDTTPKFDITFYSLRDGVHQKLATSFSGTAAFGAKFPAGFDVAIARSGGEDVVIPISLPTTNAFIGVGEDLSKHPQIFLTTDRPAYKKGEVVKFGGAVRLSNDQAYTLGGGGKIEVWSYLAGATLATATVAADGTFGGSFTVPSLAFSDLTDGQLTFFASALGSNHSDPNLLKASASIVTLGAHAPTSILTVNLDKASYVASDTVVASISAVNTKGQPLAGQTLTLNVYVAQHSVQPAEIDDFAAPTAWGDPLVDGGVKVRLDSTGHAKYSMKANVAEKSVDQEITVAVTNGTGKSLATGAASAVVYQAQNEAFLLDSWAYKDGIGKYVAHLAVESRSGARVAGQPMAYELDQIDYQGDQTISTVLDGGTFVTGASGLATIKGSYAGSEQGSSVVLKISGKDQGGNLFETATELYIGAAFGMTTDKIAYHVGDTAGITVTSGDSVGGLLTFERGRVHEYKWLQLPKGDSVIPISITPDLAPGFNVVFNYFVNGDERGFQLPIYVNNSNRLVKVDLAADKPSYSKGQVAHVTVTISDSSGAPVAATLLADGYDARMSAYRLVDQVSIAGAFLTPSPLTTNGTTSLAGIGAFTGGGCGGGDYIVLGSPYAGRTDVWITNLKTDASGHATVDVPIVQAGAIRIVVMAGTAASSFGQAETDLSVP